MIPELMRIGDEVFITISQEHRREGYNPCPDGTKATIVGFSEAYYGRLRKFGIKPGVYVSHGLLNVRLPDGKEYFEWSGRLEPTDKAEYERRFAASQEQPDKWYSMEFLRDLPETPFWEGDFIRTRNVVKKARSKMLSDCDIFQIVEIEYFYLTKLKRGCVKYPPYKISSKLGDNWAISASEDDMVLVKRGPVWKFFHNESTTFGDIKEEAQFFELLGHTKEVWNPAKGTPRWTKDEVLGAIRSGIAHGFSMCGGIFGSRSPLIMAIRFNDENLGRRVAQATLEEFGLAPA